MSGPLKTEAIVLRSIRYGEADRILHLYTPQHGRLSRDRQRRAARHGAASEPGSSRSSTSRIVLHEGRGELFTVTGVDTIAAHGPLRDHAATLDAAARACDAVARLFETSDPHPEVFRLLANELALLSSDAVHARPANGLAFRLKLLLAAGIVPQLASCASCGETEHLPGFSAAAGGVVCGSCEAAAFPLGEESYKFLVGALGEPLAQAPEASERALRQAERAISETAEHHAHVRLRPLLARGLTRAGDRADCDNFASVTLARGRHCQNRMTVSDQLLAASSEHPAGPVAVRVRGADPRPRGSRALAAGHPLLSRPAARAEPDCGLRTPFQRDRDRIVHCKAFRRLKHKTQVFVAPSGDHYRTRLTHTLEVTQVSRTVARALRLNEDLVEAIGLGHDLGHPPFGHIGEDALDRCLAERFGARFLHHEHSLRVVDTLERDGQGLNLTLPVRDGIVGHSGRAREPATLEGKIVRLVDRIAYINHDIDDAVRAGVLATDDLPAGRSRSSATPDRAGSTRSSTTSSSTPTQAGEIVQGERVGDAMSELRTFMFERVYLGPGGDARAREDRARDPRAVRPLLRPPRGDPGLDPRRRAGPRGSPTISPG